MNNLLLYFTVVKQNVPNSNHKAHTHSNDSFKHQIFLHLMHVSNMTQRDVMMITVLGHPTTCAWLDTNSCTCTETSYSSHKKGKKPLGSLIYFWARWTSLPAMWTCVTADLDRHRPSRVTAVEPGWLQAVLLLGLVLTVVAVFLNWPHHIELTYLFLTIKKLFCVTLTA